MGDIFSGGGGGYGGGWGVVAKVWVEDCGMAYGWKKMASEYGTNRWVMDGMDADQNQKRKTNTTTK